MLSIAYSILFHHDFDQFEVLMRNIYDPENVYAVHLDKSAPDVMKRRLSLFAARFRNVHVVEPMSCVWAGWSLVESELRCIRFLTRLDHDWEFHVNLSGQDMPLRNQAAIRAYLSVRRNRNFMIVEDPEREWWAPHRFQRITAEQTLIGKSLVRLPRYKRPFLKGARWYGGSQWKILSREFCEFLAHRKNTIRYERFFRFAFMPDEQFYQTLIMNGPFRDTVVADHQRYIVFPDHTAHPKVFGSEDFDELAACGKLFARKFSVARDGEIIRRIEAELIAPHSSCRAGTAA